MKKAIQTLIGSLFALAVFVAPASAQNSNNCVITNTGPNSVNTCTVEDDVTIEVTCTNGFNVENINDQTVSTGGVTVEGNTVSGNASSGEANNVNEVTTELVAFCATTTATTPETPATPVVTTATTVPVTEIKALPKTGVSNILGYTLLAVAALSSAIVATRFVVAHARNN